MVATRGVPSDTMDAESFLASDRALIDERLAILVPSSGGPAEAARHSLLAPGKRLRALLTLYAAEYCGTDPLKALDGACAVEMVHTASLIFDDLPPMDNAAIRRGLATPHVAFGEDVAILAGIGLLNGAFGALARSTLPPETRIEMVDTLAQAVGWNGLVHGQALDLEADPTTDLAAIHYGKTGVLFLAAARIGACVAPSSPGRAKAVEEYAAALGYAYQALDDILDTVANTHAAGKPTGHDGGKKTATASGDPAAIDGAKRRATDHLTAARAALDPSVSPARLHFLLDHIQGHFDRLFRSS